MFAVSYPEGDNPTEADELFLAYGSALRRDGVSYFASLSKLFFVQKAAGGDLNLWIDGQPYVNASFRSGKRGKTSFPLDCERRSNACELSEWFVGCEI